MKIRELLSSPDKWTQGVFARNSSGYRTYELDQDACSFCLMGALYRCYIDTEDDGLLVRSKLGQAIEDNTITGWNDDPKRTFAEVKELVDRLDILRSKYDCCSRPN